MIRGNEAPMDFERTYSPKQEPPSQATPIKLGSLPDPASSPAQPRSPFLFNSSFASPHPTSPHPTRSAARAAEVGTPEPRRTAASSSPYWSKSRPGTVGLPSFPDSDDEDGERSAVDEGRGGEGVDLVAGKLAALGSGVFGTKFQSPRVKQQVGSFGRKRKKTNEGDWVASATANIHHHVYHHGWAGTGAPPPSQPTHDDDSDNDEDEDGDEQKEHRGASRRKFGQMKAKQGAKGGMSATTHLIMPYVIGSYVQLVFSAAMVTVTLYIVIQFVLTVRHDLNMKAEEYAIEIMSQISDCSKQYNANSCSPETRVPAMEKMCREWEVCMMRDPREVGRLKVGAETVAEILNKLVDPLSFKTMIFGSILLFGSLISTSTLFSAAFGNSKRPPSPPPTPVPTHQLAVNPQMMGYEYAGPGIYSGVPQIGYPTARGAKKSWTPGWTSG